MTVFNSIGTFAQQQIIERALVRCTFPFDKLLPSLKREGKTSIDVTWADLSRYNSREVVRASEGEHTHIHDERGATAHPIEREIDGRRQVLGLFYLPPYTEVVLDSSLVTNPELAMEVFVCEGAHAIDYHYLDNEQRRRIVNVLHTEDLPPGTDCRDGASWTLDGHKCSWFDVGPYAMWCGEAFMEATVEAFTDITSTMSLYHSTNWRTSQEIRRIVLGEPEPEPVEITAGVDATLHSPEFKAFMQAADRVGKLSSAPKYYRDALARLKKVL